MREGLRAIGLFAGIGGIEYGLRNHRFETELLCEIDTGAQQVLKTHFPGIPIEKDIRDIRSLPKVDLIAAGFPCQDLSQAGRTAGIAGKQSSLVAEVFRLLRDREAGPRWLLLENVPFMLQLQRGKAMRYLVDELERLGFTWAYRVIDARSFGIPQRRQRVLLLASRTEDPRPVLFGCDAGEEMQVFSGQQLCGFYWTEGLRGLGWAVDAVPTLKGGSSIGIPSPPGIWDPSDQTISTPDIRDAERLQGFPEDWTAPALEGVGVSRGHRWKLVGNAVSVRMAEWIAKRLANPTGKPPAGTPMIQDAAWPRAAWGHEGHVYAVPVSSWPVREAATTLRDFLRFCRTPLSYRATVGFYSRASASCLQFQDGFLQDVKLHVDRMGRSVDASHAATLKEEPACA